jgi:citrate lyase beta subunit
MAGAHGAGADFQAEGAAVDLEDSVEDRRGAAARAGAGEILAGEDEA